MASRNKIRRINIFGGPGCGKSTLASYIYAKLSRGQYDIELVRECIKDWVYIGRSPQSFDQPYLTLRQLQKEDIALRNVEYIVSGAPILLSCFYSRSVNEFTDEKPLLQIALEFESKYPSMNILLDRGNMEYSEKGRYHTHKQALQIDDELKNYLDHELKNEISYINFRAAEWEKILNFVKSRINKNDQR